MCIVLEGRGDEVGNRSRVFLGGELAANDADTLFLNGIKCVVPCCWMGQYFGHADGVRYLRMIDINKECHW